MRIGGERHLRAVAWFPASSVIDAPSRIRRLAYEWRSPYGGSVTPSFSRSGFHTRAVQLPQSVHSQRTALRATDEMAVFGTHPYKRSSVLAWGFPDSHASMR